MREKTPCVFQQGVIEEVLVRKRMFLVSLKNAQLLPRRALFRARQEQWLHRRVLVMHRCSLRQIESAKSSIGLLLRALGYLA